LPKKVEHRIKYQAPANIVEKSFDEACSDHKKQM
jgi:hypothetical protein